MVIHCDEKYCKRPDNWKNIIMTAQHGHQMKYSATNTKETEQYAFDHFNVKIMIKDMRFGKNSLKLGENIPDIEVTLSDGRQTTLHELAAKKPLLLVTGSITCPMTISNIDSLKKLYAKLAGSFELALVYVREAHPGEHFPQPGKFEEKHKNAEILRAEYGFRHDIIVDSMDGRLHNLLDTKPNSVHIINGRGEILARSLWSGDIRFTESILTRLQAGDNILQHTSQRMIMPFLKGAGYMHNILKTAGNRSYRELMIGAPPIAALSLLSSCFTRLAENHRGVAAVASLILILLIMFFVVFLI